MKPILDISYYQDPTQINYDKLLSQVAGIIIRAGYGTRKDTAFERHYSEIKARNIPVGAYHFMVEYKTVDEQLAMVRQALSGKSFELGFWVDVELESGAEPLTRNTIIEYMTKAGSLVYGIYTGAWCWNPIMGKNNPYSNIPLWVADYANSKPNLPYGWNTWLLWQYTSSGRLQGYAKNLDMNRFNGTEDQFKAWVRGEGKEPLPPEEEEVLFQIEVVCGALNIRSGPGVDYSWKGVTYKGDVHNVYEERNNWFRIGDGLWVSGYPAYVRKITPPAPEPTLEEKVNKLWAAHPELH
jgi:GH25 family lysozyme M1 (1,4-beta-N-acetylmuramidase)